jgi:hypothetical protein
MPKPMAILAKPLAEHADRALRQYATGDRLSSCLTPGCFVELQSRRSDGAILPLQFPVSASISQRRSNLSRST